MTSLLALVALAVFGVAGAGAEDDPEATPPPFDGALTFPAIQWPEGAEAYSWTVQLEPLEELVQVDERHAEVRYDDDLVVLQIEAPAAHDAEGASVPTTIAVSEGDVVTLTVHHRAGNPAAGGAPFHYPVVHGVGWEGGLRTYSIPTPPNEPEEPIAAPKCVVPRLTGSSLASVRERLAKRGCKLGAIRGKRGKGTKVVKQFRDPGAVLGAGARVAVKLG